MQYQNADTKSVEDMAYISVDLEYASNKLPMIEVNLWALGQEGQVPRDGTIRGVQGNKDLESWGGCHKPRINLKIFNGYCKALY